MSDAPHDSPTPPSGCQEASTEQRLSLGDTADRPTQVGGLPPSAVVEERRQSLKGRWDAGDHRPADAYLADHPSLAADENALFDLAQAEMSLRGAAGEVLQPQEYQERFPQIAERLEALFHFWKLAAPDVTASDARPATESRPKPIPRQFGRYRVLSVLGSGAFGAVYKCYDEALKRPVAVKVPHLHRVSSPEQVDAYLSEAQALAQLDHPGIVRVYDFGRLDDHGCFIVSALVEGESLAARLKRGPPAVAEAAELAAQVAEALHHAHERGLIHRDVKPANILLSAEGRPVVVDFGLALREEEFGRGSGFVGTPAYMSPEQARGEGHRVDARSDVYSLGVVLFEMLTGRLPFEGTSAAAVIHQIKTYEARPPRQLNRNVPRELDRICLKALAMRAADRYSTARDLAEELRAWLARRGTAGPAMSPEVPAGSNAQAVRVIPRGLRAFGPEDADFFLGLLPGPRDRDGVPESVLFWKARLEQTDADQTFPVGLLFGPSGCGKSSLVRAGLVPRLAGHVVPVVVEASPTDTEVRLLRAMRRACPGLPADTSLADALRLVRQGPHLSAGRKVVLVLDQFEQWLNAHPTSAGTDLVDALRQCDGGRVQALLLVRDDFGMAVTRFLRELEVGLVEGRNFATVDLFDQKHALKVLTEFGRAYNRLPDDPNALTSDQRVFLDRAIAGLSQGGRVISVRLALFVETVKGRPWLPRTLEEIGGAAGSGAAFLEEVLSQRAANPVHRMHRYAARAVLTALLPRSGSDLKGAMQPRSRLLTASGYAARPRDFDEVLHLLDTDLRLITPSEPEPTDAPSTASAEPHYQLTHDYLVPSLREWLTQKQRQTRRGRAELLLRECAQAWASDRKDRLLPSLVETTTIAAWTRWADWSEVERAMLWRALLVHGRQFLVGTATVAVLALALATLRKPPPPTPLERFLQRSAPVEERLAALDHVPVENQGELARALLELGLERDGRLLVPALTQFIDGVHKGRIDAHGRESLVNLLGRQLADPNLDEAVHRAAFQGLVDIGAAGDIAGGIVSYLRADQPQPLDAAMLGHLLDSPATRDACLDDSEAAHRLGGPLLKTLESMAGQRGDESRRGLTVQVLARIAPPWRALQMAAQLDRELSSAATKEALRHSLEQRLIPGKLPDAKRAEGLGQLTDLLRTTRDREVRERCLALLDAEPVERLVPDLIQAMKERSIDPAEGAFFSIQPYAAATSASRREAMRQYLERQLQPALDTPTDQEVPYSYHLHSVILSIHCLRGPHDPPWPAAQVALARLLARPRGVEGQDMVPTLLDALVRLAPDAPGPVDVAPIQAILARKDLPTGSREAAARALGRLGDEASALPLRELAVNRENEPRLRVAAVEALGLLAERLPKGHPTLRGIQKDLELILRRHAEERNQTLTSVALTAFSRAAEVAQAPLLFDFIVAIHQNLTAVPAVHRLLRRSSSVDRRTLVEMFLNWRAPLRVTLALEYEPEQALLGFVWPQTPNESPFPEESALPTARDVAAALAQAHTADEPAVRRLAASLLERLLIAPEAPRLTMNADPASQKDLVKQWQAWWAQHQERWVLKDGRLIPR